MYHQCMGVQTRHCICVHGSATTNAIWVSILGQNKTYFAFIIAEYFNAFSYVLFYLYLLSRTKELIFEWVILKCCWMLCVQQLCIVLLRLSICLCSNVKIITYPRIHGLVENEMWQTIWNFIFTHFKLWIKQSSPATHHGGTCGGEEYSSYSFLTSALDGGEWSASRPGRTLPWEKDPWYLFYRRLGGPQSRSGHRG
jgi:hypothetical protein